MTKCGIKIDCPEWHFRRGLIVCSLLTCLIAVGSCRKNNPHQIVRFDNYYFWAERLRPPADANGDTDILERRKLAFEMLSNGIPDKRAIILNASVKRQPTEYGALSVRNDTILSILVVDESNQVGFIHYSASNDPNAFGKPLFGLSDYRLLFGEWSSKDSPPVYYWTLFLKSYEDIRDFRLLKHQSAWYCWWAVLETPEAEFDSLTANCGQIMLFDREYKLLDRLALRPPRQNDLLDLPER